MAEVCQTCTDRLVRLMTLRGEVAGVAALISAELDAPTMPWKKLLPLVQRRLESAAQSAIGG